MIMDIGPREKVQPTASLTIAPNLGDDRANRIRVQKVIEALQRKGGKREIKVEVAGTYEKGPRVGLHAHLIVFLPKDQGTILNDLVALPSLHIKLFKDRAEIMRAVMYRLKERERINPQGDKMMLEAIERRMKRWMGKEQFSRMLRLMARTNESSPSDYLTNLRYQEANRFIGDRFKFTAAMRKRFRAAHVKSCERQNRNRLMNGKSKKHTQNKLNRLKQTAKP